MGKDPSAVILATAMAFCALCPLFVTSNYTDKCNITSGIASLSKIVVKYQAELDSKVKFVQLQDAIDEIDKAMLDYNGRAKDKLPQIRSLNSDARLNYQNCVGAVFEWCHSINSTFGIILRSIEASNLTEYSRNILWNMTISSLELGFDKTGKSLDLLTYVQNRTAELENTFQGVLHDVHYDFGPEGFYGKKKFELEEIRDIHHILEQKFLYVSVLFSAICALIMGPIGVALALPAAFATYDIVAVVHGGLKKEYQEQIDLIQEFFTVVSKKIEDATEIVKDIENALEEDKTNLHQLRGELLSAGINKNLLLSDMPFLRRQVVSELQKLGDSCAKYVIWHGYDAPFYQKVSSRTRRAATTFCENQRSNARRMLAESGSSNSTQSQKLGLTIDQMDCGGYVPPNSTEHHGFQK
ncbi:hypothetical protein KR074_000950 [Drosophila pseudoananassae]|nr:hypothetical protein KR074_000950 [Drosophila pseudoananassae]